MAQKRAARRGRKAVPSPGSKDSVELGLNGEYLSTKEPSPEGGDGSQSDHFRKGSESMDEEIAIRALAAMAAARDGPPKTTKPSAPATAEPTSSSEDHGGLMSSTYCTSRRQAKKLPPSEEEEDKKESEEEWTEAPGPNPQPKRKRAPGRVTRSQQRKVLAPAQQGGKEVPQPSESKKITLAPLQQQLSELEMPKSKKATPAPLLQQQGEERAQPSESEMPKSKRIRRIWTPSDEVQILTALVEHRRKQGKLPAPDNNGFFDSVAERLEDKSCTRFIIKDKVRSLMRRYKSYVAPTTDHEQRLLDLSNSVWGDLPATHPANRNNGGEQDEGEHAMAEVKNGGGQTVDRSFEEMCQIYPLLGQEVKRLAGVQPTLRNPFTGLDGKRALLMEKKLDRLKWKELKIQSEMETKVEAPKARIRKQIVNFLSEVSKSV